MEVEVGERFVAALRPRALELCGTQSSHCPGPPSHLPALRPEGPGWCVEKASVDCYCILARTAPRLLIGGA